jgi:hypothetical protein
MTREAVGLSISSLEPIEADVAAPRDLSALRIANSALVTFSDASLSSNPLAALIPSILGLGNDGSSKVKIRFKAILIPPFLLASKTVKLG